MNFGWAPNEFTMNLYSKKKSIKKPRQREIDRAFARLSSKIFVATPLHFRYTDKDNYLGEQNGNAKFIMLNQFTITYPATLPDFLQISRETFEQEAKLAMAVKLFEMKRLPSGIAAQSVEMDRVTFLLTLHRFGVAMIDLEEKELLSDIDHA